MSERAQVTAVYINGEVSGRLHRCVVEKLGCLRGEMELSSRRDRGVFEER